MRAAPDLLEPDEPPARVLRPIPLSGLEQGWPVGVRVAVWVLAVLAAAGGTALQPMIGAGVALVVAGALFLLHRPVVGALLVVGVVPAVSGLARGLPVPGARVSEILLAGTAVLVLLLTRIDEPPWRAVDWWLLLFAVATLGLGTAGAIRHDIPFDNEALSDLLQPFQYLLIVRVAATALVRREDRARALRWALWASAVVVLIAIVQRVVPAVQDLFIPLTGSDNYAFNELYFVSRATGPFPIWHFLGGYLLVVALLAVALLMHGDTEVLARRWLVLVLVLDVVGIVLTLTLAIILGLVLGFVVLALWSGRGRLWLGRGAAAGLAVAILASPLIGGRVQDQLGAPSTGESWVPETLSFRYEVWTEQFFPSLATRWVTGYGPGLPPEITWRFTESVYITYLLQGGLVLLLVFLALNLVLLRTMLDQRDPQDTARTSVASAVAAMVVVLIPLHGIFPYMTGLGLPQIFWALAGVALARGRVATSTSASPVRRSRRVVVK